MADIFRFSPSDIPQATVTGGDVANAFMGSFFAAQQNVRANEGLALEERRLGMAEQQFAQQTEDRAWDNQFMRPIRQQQAILGVESTALQIKGAQQQLQVQSMEMADRLQRKSQLEAIQNDMIGYGSGGQKVEGGVPTTSYSFGAAVGGPDEMQDKWTNRGYSATGKNLTRGVVAVNTSKYPLGTVFRDDDSGEVYIAADKHGNKDPNVVDIFREPDQYKPEKVNRNLRVIGNAGAVPKTPEGVQAVLDRFRSTPATVGTGVDARTPAGAPVYAEVAASPNPVAAATSAFTPTQQRFLKHYDYLQSVAAADPRSPDGLQAGVLMRSMEANPEFQAALGQRGLILEAARNQAVITQSLLGARQDQLTDFQRAYPQFRLNALPNGQIVPVNALTGGALTPPEQAAFGSSWTQHSKTFKPGTTDLLGDTALSRYTAAVGTYNSGKAFLSRPDTDLTDEERRLKYQALGAREQARQFERLDPRLNTIAQEEAAAAAEAAAAEARRAASVTPQTGPATQPKRIDDLTAAPKPAGTEENDRVWTDLKTTLNTRLSSGDYPDNGRDTQENPALSLAARIYKGSQEALDTAVAAFGKPRSAALGKVKVPLGTKTLQPGDIARGWAEDVLIKYGYLDPQTKKPPTATPAGQQGGGLTEEQKAALDKVMKSI